MEIRRIEPEEAQRLLESGEGWTYLDVRTREEFDAGHVPGAVNIPIIVRNTAGRGMVPNPSFLQDVAERFGNGDRIITGCQRGGRSLKAAQILQMNGFAEVVDMRGGYDGEISPDGAITFPGWARRGLPTSTEP